MSRCRLPAHSPQPTRSGQKSQPAGYVVLLMRRCPGVAAPFEPAERNHCSRRLTRDAILQRARARGARLTEALTLIADEHPGMLCANSLSVIEVIPDELRKLRMASTDPAP